MGGLGGALMEGNSKLFEGPLGVVKIGFNGYDLGKTTADSNLTPDQDIKDILFQQDGTKAGDNVRTGIEYVLSATFGEIKTGLLVEMMNGISSETANPNKDSGTIGRNIYTSMRDNEAKVLKIASVDENGVPSIIEDDILYFYEAIPIVEGELINWGADTQRNFPVSFKIKYHIFATGESSTKVGAFGYWGDPTIEDVPPVVYPDVEAPELSTGNAPSATSLELTFDEDIAFQSSFVAGHYSAKVEGVFVAPSAGDISNKVLTLTFGAGTFSADDEIEISISNIALEDTESTANTYPGIEGFICTESI